ncbi:MAG: DUF4397 domain-containing protein [Ginsengibacter sp.]
MKQLISLFRRNILPVAAFLAVSFLFAACKKTLDTPTQDTAAGLMAFNLTTDQPSIGVALSNNRLTNSPLAYTSYTGGYLGVYTGSKEVTSYDFYSGSTLATGSQVFDDSAYYSLFVLGSAGTYKNVFVKDNLDSLPTNTGDAFIRYINAITDSTAQPVVTISSNGANVFNDNPAFATVSNFKQITPGSISINVKNETTVDSTRNITLEAGKVYTVLFTGIPNATDVNKAVQIKYIQNGVITP